MKKCWKNQINGEEGYDLKIWLYPLLTNSCIALSRNDITLENERELVVCEKEFNTGRFPSLMKDLEMFSFQAYYNDDIYYQSEFGLAQFHTQRRFFSKEEMLKEMDKLGAKREPVIFDNGQRDIKYTVMDENKILWIATSKG